MFGSLHVAGVAGLTSGRRQNPASGGDAGGDLNMPDPEETYARPNRFGPVGDICCRCPDFSAGGAGGAVSITGASL